MAGGSDVDSETYLQLPSDDQEYWDSFESFRSQRTRTVKHPPEDDTFFDVYVRPLIAEFVGTLILVYIGSMSVRTDSILDIAVGHGVILTALCVAFGRVSGAHVNPAVTVGALIGGTIGEYMAGLYVVVQILGSVLGALMVRLCLDYVPEEEAAAGDSSKTVYESMGGGGPSVAAGLSMSSALVTEAQLTFLLVLVVLMSTARDRNTTLAPIAIGLTLTGCIIAGGPSTGAALNPVRAFGPAVASFGITNAWAAHWVYWLGPLLGGCLAGLLFRTLMAPFSMRLFF